MIFEYLEKKSNEIAEVINTSAIRTQLDQLELILYTVLTLWILFKGYMILAGKTEEPIKDFIWDLTIKLMVIAITFSESWISLIGEAVKGLVEWASGDVSLYKRLDELYLTALNIGAIMEDTDGTFELTGFFSQLEVMLSFALVALSSVGIILASTIVLNFLLMVSPFMIFSLISGTLKDMFSGWLKLVINLVLITLFIGVSFNILSDKYKEVIDTSLKNIQSGTSIVSTANDIFFVSMIVTLLILMSVYIATQLTRISIATLPGSTAMSAAGNARSAGGGAAKGTGKAIGAVSTASTTVGNRFGKRK